MIAKLSRSLGNCAVSHVGVTCHERCSNREHGFVSSSLRFCPARATTVSPREPEKFSNEQPHYAA